MAKYAFPTLFLLACATALGAEPSVTIYNQNFGVVREIVPITLPAGVGEVEYNAMTAHVEPDSVMLRDPAGKRQIRILEQNYRNDPVSQELLLSIYEGKTIDFRVVEPNSSSIVPGQDYPQRIRAASAGMGALRAGVLSGPSVRPKHGGPAHRRGKRRNPFRPSGVAHVSCAYGRHHPETDDEVEDRKRPGGAA